eukprot:1673416-Amphidinium_carterae.1
MGFCPVGWEASKHRMQACTCHGSVWCACGKRVDIAVCTGSCYLAMSSVATAVQENRSTSQSRLINCGKNSHGKPTPPALLWH